MKIAKIILILLILSNTNIFGVVTRNYSSSRKGFYNNGTYNGIMLTEQGSLILAPIIEKDGAIEGKFIWKIYNSSDGSMYAAISGDGAELYKREAGESDFNLFVKSTNESAFTSVISDNSGNIYASTAPYARIIKYDKSGNEIWSKNVDDTYIWDMKFDNNGNLYAAAGGNNARVLKISSNGNITEILKTEEQHAMSLYFDSKNNKLYIGTAGRGLVLSVDLSTNLENPSYKTVYDTAQNEVYAITMDNIGNLYFGTATREPSYLILPSIIDGGKLADDSAKEFRNSLYKADTNGTVQRLFFLNQTLVFALSSDIDNNIYFITGDNADIYKINGNDGLLSYIGGLENKTLSTFSATKDGLYFAISKTGEIYKMQNGNPSEGSFISDTLDLKLLSKLGSLKAMTTIPDGSDISFEVRTGNVARVDNTWSDFTKVSEDGKINAPDGRFLQFKITMKNSNANEKSVPVLSSMDFTYIENNLPPDVLNGGLTTYYKQQNDSSETTKSPQLEENETMIYWKGSDPNGDKLIYDLEYRLKGEKNYRKLANNLETPYFRFKSYLMPSGIYDFRITASDRFDNPIDLSKTKTLEVLNIKYDNDSPEIFDFAVKTEGNKRIITFRAEDKLSFLKTVRYSTITEEWHYILPDDKVLDSMSENFTIIIEDEEAGSITIEVLDTEGNIKYYSFVI
ncbi:sugar-binding protein [Brachyspira aalborgi]|uniref:Sugar-binding protein n=1 Tax=Brachyspira aalborgi TaxID=29522 RepID=A0A5C8E767_9SPIR|nr:sugar-binding protein [Brachyspira aalborgi]TXJ33829.1 sugar-binding protein [Brachyspira aalborgi]